MASFIIAEIADAQLKAIVSGEKTTAEKKHQPPFDFHPFSTCWFGTNHMPHSRDFSDAIFRRAIVITFNRKFEGANRDVNLKYKLNQELPGILNLALEGMTGVFERSGFTSCHSSEEAKEKWRSECDQVIQFLEDCCHLSPTSQVPSKAIFHSYTEWARQMGIKKTLGHNGLIIRLQRMGIERDRTASTRLLKGIELKEV
jgi:putative DNA primase/helicase